MNNPFFWCCHGCDVLWQGPIESTCWICDGPHGPRCEDDFVYTAPSMNPPEITSDL